MATGDGAPPVLIVDGADFSDLDGFAREFSKLLHDFTWRGNLDDLRPDRRDHSSARRRRRRA